MLKMECVRKDYESFSLNCSLEVKSGYVTGLIGKNGAGKSTIFKIILGLIAKDSGTIQLFDKEIQTLNEKEKQQLGVVLSNSGFNGYLTIHDILPILEHLYEHFDKSFFVKQIQRFGLPQNQKIKEFSTGMKAKLKILAAISHHAKFLLLDEPTAGLDVTARDELLDMLRDFMEQDESRSILISSHISTDLETLCDDLYMIDDGKIIFHEDTDVLLSDYALLKVTPQQYTNMDKQYILKCKRENYGYRCLTNQKQYYLENYPNIAVENGTIDEIITMMSGGAEI
ncbi:MAG: ABC transporter ATP-binding protein [Clostridium sp.]|nr:ABC transporter ATP-binding protein [Clostridium sp.]